MSNRIFLLQRPVLYQSTIAKLFMAAKREVKQTRINRYKGMSEAG